MLQPTRPQKFATNSQDEHAVKGLLKRLSCLNMFTAWTQS